MITIQSQTLLLVVVLVDIVCVVQSNSFPVLYKYPSYDVLTYSSEGWRKVAWKNCCIGGDDLTSSI